MIKTKHGPIFAFHQTKLHVAGHVYLLHHFPDNILHIYFFDKCIKIYLYSNSNSQTNVTTVVTNVFPE